MAIFGTALVVTGLTLLSGTRYQDEVATLSDGLRAVRDISAEMREMANRDDDMEIPAGISSLYTLYHGLVRRVPGLPNGEVSVTIHADENTVPFALGGPQDLNFDGDATDVLDGQASGIDLKVVPVEISLSYVDARGPITRNHWLRVTRTAN